MMGLGLVLGLVGYAAIHWGVNSIQGNPQTPFVQQIFPFAK